MICINVDEFIILVYFALLYNGNDDTLLASLVMKTNPGVPITAWKHRKHFNIKFPLSLW